MTAADTTDFLAIHRCLRLAGRALARAAAELDPAERTRVVALGRYWNGYTAEVLHHHTVEDEIFYPALVEREPRAFSHLARIDEDHHRLDELMAEGTEALGALAEGRRAPRAAGVLAELDSAMWAHLDYEDADLVPLFPAYFDADEYAQLVKGASTGLSLSQAMFTVPFIGSWLDGPTRAALLGDAPLPFKIIYRLARKRHEHLAEAALGDHRDGAGEPVLAVVR